MGRADITPTQPLPATRPKTLPLPVTQPPRRVCEWDWPDRLCARCQRDLTEHPDDWRNQ